MAFKFYCSQCGHSEYISGSAERRCFQCGWSEGQPIKENYMTGADACPDCGCALDWECIDDTLYQISGGYDAREFIVSCPACDFRERRRE